MLNIRKAEKVYKNSKFFAYYFLQLLFFYMKLNQSLFIAAFLYNYITNKIFLRCMLSDYMYT